MQQQRMPARWRILHIELGHCEADDSDENEREHLEP